MVSPANTFSDLRKTKEPHRPPPLNLKSESKRSGRAKVKAVRGSVSGPSIQPSHSVAHRPTSAAGTAGASCRTLKASGPKPHKWVDMDLSKSRPRQHADGRDVSPQGSLRTIIDLDSPAGSDDESDISPLSDDRPPVNSNKVLARFFPELQNNFVLPAADAADQKLMPLKGHSRLESEIHARVHSLYQGDTSGHGDSADNGYGSSNRNYRSSDNSINGGHDDNHSSWSLADRMNARVPNAPHQGAPIAPTGPDLTGAANNPLPEATRNAQSTANIDHIVKTTTPIIGPSRVQTGAGHETDYPRSGEHRLGKRTLLVLDGPLQISRSNGGDLVANRPAPQPAGKPYSSSIHSSNHSGSNLLAIDTSKKDSPHRASSTRSPRDLASLKKGHKYAKSKDSDESIKDGKVPKSRDESKGFWGKAAKSEDKKNFRTSFSLSMATFHRKQGSQNESHSRRLSILSSRSETSVDPTADKPSPTAEPPTRLSRHLSISESNLENMSPSSPKREDLLLQLPRLQTHDLGLGNLLDQFAPSLTSTYETAPAASTEPSEDTSSQPPTPTARPAPPASAGSEAREVIIAELDDGKRGTVIRVDEPGQSYDGVPVPKMRMVSSVADEKIVIANHRSRGSQAFVSTAKASSVFLPPEQVYELAAAPTSPRGSIHELTGDSRPRFRVNFPIEETKDVIVELLMERIPSLDDLFNLALVNRRFYRVFKQRELTYIKMALYKMSRPAWELREMSPPWNLEWQLTINPDSQVPEYDPTLYLDRYARDIFTLAQLKSMILVRCAPFLRRDTVRGLAGLDDDRAEEVDNAFWRIWTFCRIFGNGKGRRERLGRPGGLA
ncbi:hypothetical protein N7470_004046 [Penicillium chermesinum]|nr:hypothetical protein N7470_004046 [Penicillium chermesinum]